METVDVEKINEVEVEGDKPLDHNTKTEEGLANETDLPEAEHPVDETDTRSASETPKVETRPASETPKGPENTISPRSPDSQNTFALLPSSLIAHAGNTASAAPRVQ